MRVTRLAVDSLRLAVVTHGFIAKLFSPIHTALARMRALEQEFIERASAAKSAQHNSRK
jgi:hypothetical protein